MHIPALYAFVKQLSKHCDLAVYSLAPRNWTQPTGTCGHARVRFIPAHHAGGTVRKTLLLTRACMQDHRTTPFDAVHGFWGIPAGVAAVLAGKANHCPSLVTFMGGETADLPKINYGNMSRFLPRHVTLWVARRADRLITLSTYQVDEMRKRNSLMANASVIPFGVDPSLFRAMPKHISARPLRLLNVSHLNPLKDHSTLLRAFVLVQQSIDARLRIVGTDQRNGEMQRLANDLGIRDKVEFAGTVDHEEMPKQYAWGHILVHTSLHEAGVLAVVEAAASGLAIAGTHTGLIADFEGTSSITNKAEDSDTLARNILEIASHPERYDAMRQAALGWSAGHTDSWTVREHKQLYSSLARTFTSGRP
jgi:glycosyltransferase involved in cell wall biosynthesis